MAETASKRRRRGREDFYPGENPEMVCPYTKGYMWEERARDWLDGWKEAEKTYHKRQEDAEQICPHCGQIMR